MAEKKITTDGTQKRIDELVEFLIYNDYRYYILSDPEVSDAEYDMVWEELKELEEKHPDMVRADSPIQNVSGRVSAQFVPRPHPVPMLSLAKVYSAEDLAATLAKFKALEDQVAIEPKFDGVSLTLRYENGALVYAATRGDGITGEDVTMNAKQVKGVVTHLPQPFTGEVRGEVMIHNKSFQALLDKGFELANPRNAASGALRQKDPKQVKERLLEFFAYDVIEDDPKLKSQVEAAQFLRDLGFTVEMQELVAISDVQQQVNDFAVSKKALDYETDGMVIKLNTFALRAHETMLTTSSHHPKFAIAFKYPTEQAFTRLIGVTWQVGRRSSITPVAELEPITITGSTVARATLHNPSMLKQKDIRIGDMVIVEKAGEIIPQVIGRVPSYQRDGNEKEIVIPTACPECGGKVNAAVTGRLQCQNPDCSAIHFAQLAEFGARKSLDIESLGEKMVRKLIDAGLVNEYPDFFTLTADQLVQLDGVKETMAAKLVASIDAAKSAGFARVLRGLSIALVSSTTAKVLAKKYPDLLTLAGVARDNPDELLEIDDIGQETSDSMHAYFSNDHNVDNLKLLVKLGVNIDAPAAPAAATQTLQGKKFVITGTLSEPRDVIKERIEDAGGKASSSLSANTDYLVVGEKAGSKLAKAEKLGVTIVAEADLNALLTGGTK